MKSKISDNECHNADTNNQNDKIPEPASSELRYTTININKTTRKIASIKSTTTITKTTKISAKMLLAKKSTMTTLITA